jgi:hypothetical protein
LIFNLDEAEISNWQDRKPATMRGQKIHDGISRNLKHISVIACVFTAGESLTPYIVTLQDSIPVQEARRSFEVRLNLEVESEALCQRRKCFRNFQEI